MRYRLHHLPLGFGLALAVSAPSLGAQTCTLEYRRADNMWANWGRPDGYLGVETITLQPGQKKIFATDWSYEKQRNDGANFYGSHLRHAVNRGAGSVNVRLRGPGQVIVRPAAKASATTTISIAGLGSMIGAILRSLKSDQAAGLSGGLTTLQPGDTSMYRHDLMEIGCSDAPATIAAATALAPEPPPPPVLLSLTGTPATPTTTTIAVTVQAHDAKTGTPLTGQVTINGVAGTTGQAITYTRCTETLEFEDSRGVTRTRTVRAPCEGTVKISGYPDVFFIF